MKAPDPVWKMTYKSSRRKHNHRCRHCWNVLQDGDEVYMARIKAKTTWCVHVDCGWVELSDCKGFTVYDKLYLQGLSYLIKTGFKSLEKEYEELNAKMKGLI